jgi:hypothetical protein
MGQFARVIAVDGGQIGKDDHYLRLGAVLHRLIARQHVIRGGVDLVKGF